MESFEEAWGIICSYCKTKITDVAYNTWISRIEPIELDFDKNKAVILVPNDFHRQTITRCYLSLLNEAFEAVFGQIFVIEMKIPEEISVKEEQQAAANAEITDISYEYTFDTFYCRLIKQICSCSLSCSCHKSRQCLQSAVFIRKFRSWQNSFALCNRQRNQEKFTRKNYLLHKR